MSLTLHPIGIVRSCFKEKFGIPRQPGLVPAATAWLELTPEVAREEAWRGLDGFSHVWVTFQFHGVPEGKWNPTVRPPRLGGNQRLGVFATRSTYRPNSLGLSVVGFGGMETREGKLGVRLLGVDLLEGTPVFDIKPYLPYADILPNATGGFAPQSPDATLAVVWTTEAEQQCQELTAQTPEFRDVVEQVLRLDPRPAYARKGDNDRTYGVHLFDSNVRWHIEGTSVIVESIQPAS